MEYVIAIAVIAVVAFILSRKSKSETKIVSDRPNRERRDDVASRDIDTNIP